ncbi:MAG TPA: hypothetical protein PK555_09675, partial [Steroidobacteraceae bacterium]|nr:hypothetical protein [Steroidobacteraceae bacterium]
EAAVVGRPHEIKGESVFAFVVCRGPRPTGDTSKFVGELREWVTQQLGAIARPDEIRFTDNLPKTRSGKIMRRLLRTIARGEEITQDISTLENPAIVDQLLGVERAKSQGPGAKGKKRAATKKRATGSVRRAAGKKRGSPKKRAAGKKRAVGKKRAASSGRRAVGKKRTALKKSRPARKRRRG